MVLLVKFDNVVHVDDKWLRSSLPSSVTDTLLIDSSRGLILTSAPSGSSFGSAHMLETWCSSEETPTCTDFSDSISLRGLVFDANFSFPNEVLATIFSCSSIL